MVKARSVLIRRQSPTAAGGGPALGIQIEHLLAGLEGELTFPLHANPGQIEGDPLNRPRVVTGSVVSHSRSPTVAAEVPEQRSEATDTAVFDRVWHWRRTLPERKGQRCRIIARGTMNSAMVEFEDGFRPVVSRFAIRKAAHA